MGPLEVMAIEFPGNRFNGEIMLTLTSAVDTGAIRIVDLTFLAKDASGFVTSYELAELDEPDAVPFDLVDRTMGLLSVGDIDKIGDLLRVDSTAALIVFEHAWAANLRRAVVSANGRLVTHQRVPDAVAKAAVADAEAKGK
jgi:hypothetical protein